VNNSRPDPPEAAAVTPDVSARPPPTDWLPDALTGIGLAVLATDASGRVLYSNPVAELLTGWPADEAVGRPLATVFRSLSETTRTPGTDSGAEVLATGTAVSLSDHTVLIGRGGREWRIDHGAAPVRDAAGRVVGAVVVFCDVGERQRLVQGVEDAQAFADGIVQTVREPLLILDSDLRVTRTNAAFCRTFGLAPTAAEGRSLFDLGGGQWDSPGLRELLEQILPRDSHFDEFTLDRVFDGLGLRSMVLNARRLPPAGRREAMILLAVEDATVRHQAAAALALSETRYRRLFETAQDGILLVDPDTGHIFDANPFLTDLLGYTRDDLVGKGLWEIGLFRDTESSRAAFRTLQEKGYIRYEDLPLRTHDGRGIEVEFVSNVYPVGDTRVIQCNIRDITDRRRAEDALRAAHSQLEARVAERTAELARSNEQLLTEIARREVAEQDRRRLQQQLTTVQEDERRRIARELHDQLGQHLTALGLGLKVVKEATPNPSPEWDRLHGLQALTDRVGREVHHLALELRPTALDDFGLPAALANYAEGWAERTGVEVDFQGYRPDGGRLPSAVETALYRVVQEALTNVLRHADARRVSVVLQRVPGRVTAVVEDDGQGFDADTVTLHRLGILGMRERVTLVGGTLAVESGPGRGTTVIARIPLPADADRGDHA
jgi:PAS domain S-box-containing protein